MLRTIYEIVPAAIKFHRTRLGLTFEAASKRCNVPKGVIAEAEAGQRRGKPSLPSLDTLSRLAKGLGIPLHVLLEEEFSPERFEHSIDECARRVHEFVQNAPTQKRLINPEPKAATAEPLIDRIRRAKPEELEMIRHAVESVLEEDLSLKERPKVEQEP